MEKSNGKAPLLVFCLEHLWMGSLSATVLQGRVKGPSPGTAAPKQTQAP